MPTGRPSAVSASHAPFASLATKSAILAQWRCYKDESANFRRQESKKLLLE
jgi:hypothetical protein